MIEKYKYIIYLIFSLCIYIIYKLIKKELFKDKIKDLKSLILILTFISYFYILISYRAKFIYDMTYMKSIIIILSISIIYFTYGIIVNKEKIYNKNISIYLILYIILLISITMIIGRIDFNFKLSNIDYLRAGNLIPFKSIKAYITHNVLLKTKVYNIIGNMVMLIPLSFLLMIKDKKYNSLLKQTLIILPIIVLIEFLQVLTLTGTFDIDDIILNYFGSIIFVFLITRFDIIGKIRKIFYTDFKLNYIVKITLFILSLIIPIIFIIDTIIRTI